MAVTPIPGRESAKEKQEAMEVAEAARQEKWEYPSFLGELFMGRFRPELIHPYPEQSPEDKRIGDALMAKTEAFLKNNLDPDEADRKGEIPPHVIKGLADLGLFGMKIPREYGGLGLSQVNYGRVVSMVGTYCGSTAVWLSAHQSIGVPQPLKMFGTPEQKKKYLPRLARGEISAFALTEPGVGSDPAKMETTATPVEGGAFYLLNGEKLWCTNGPDASIIVVMARTPSKVVNGKERKQITAFIVETNTPGVETAARCQFMGIRAISNGLLRFKNAKVPRENIIWGEGQGLKLALNTLNAGRMTLPAACAGAAKVCINMTRDWANERVQWGAPIGRHDAIAGKIAKIMADTFAMEAISWLTSSMVDRGGTDIRLEAAMCKLLGSEWAWRIADETLQIRGGRGYETESSLKNRGEKGYPMERILRDVRINRLIEGSSEILHLFIAREALDPHMQRAGALLNPRSPLTAKLASLGKMAAFYTTWYPARWLRWSSWPKHSGFAGSLASHLRFIDRQSSRLGRTIFHCMAVHQARLERRQRVLHRAVDIGGELFAMAASCSRAEAMLKANPADRTPYTLADLFCRHARRRIKQLFRDIWSNDDKADYAVAVQMLEGKMTWIEEGIAQGDVAPLTRQSPTLVRGSQTA